MDEENQTFIQTRIAKNSGDIAKVQSCEGRIAEMLPKLNLVKAVAHGAGCYC